MSSDIPPPNRAIGWYRFVLWMLPWSIAVGTWLGLMRLEDQLGGPEWPWFAGWLIFNLSATGGIGAIEDRRRTSHRGEIIPVNRGKVARFVFLQVLIIPWFAVAILFSVCSVIRVLS